MNKRNLYKNLQKEFKRYERLQKRIEKLLKEKELSATKISVIEADLARQEGNKDVRMV